MDLTISLIAIILVVLALLCAWFARLCRFQFSLISLLALVTAIAIALSVISAWPKQVAIVRVPRIDAAKNKLDLTHDGLVLDVTCNWRRTTVKLTPDKGFSDGSKVELLWCESGAFRHVVVAERGAVFPEVISAPNNWPLIVAVVEFHPNAIHIEGRRIESDGRVDGEGGTFDVGSPSFNTEIAEWGPEYLEKLRSGR